MIHLSHVSKRYAGQIVLDDVSIEIARGSFVALVGTSGAGKTTLLKAINRLVEIDTGSILVDGDDVAAMPVQTLRRGIGYVFQGVGLFPHMSVAQNIWLGPRLQGAPAAGMAARVVELLELVALPASFADRAAAQLSGGQAQRVGLARALASRPPIMLMDEPFGALDPVTRADLAATYRALHDRMGLTSVMVTHDMAEALLLADRVVVLDAGRILADRSPVDLIREPGHPGIAAMIGVARDASARLEALARAQ